MFKISDRLKFSTLATVFTLAYTLYLCIKLNFLDQHWYVITAPIATFISSYILWKLIMGKRLEFLSTLPLSIVLTIVSHVLNLFLFSLYVTITGQFNGAFETPFTIIPAFVLLIGTGTITSLYNGGLVSAIIFLFSGILTVVISRLSRKNYSKGKNNLGSESQTKKESCSNPVFRHR